LVKVASETAAAVVKKKRTNSGSPVRTDSV